MEKELAQSDLPVWRKIQKTTRNVTFLKNCIFRWFLDFFFELVSPIELREHLRKKKMFSFGHCPNEGGEGPARIKKTLYKYSFLTAEKDVQVARNGGRKR